jgi:hypothetical protein
MESVSLAETPAESQAHWKLSGRIGLILLSILMLADFLFRGIALAFHSGKNDFSEPYVAAWLWRHGQNFADSALATSTAIRLTGYRDVIAPVYPPSTLIAVAPLTFLPWGWANFCWLLLLFAAIGVSIKLLLQLGHFRRWDDRALLFAAFVLAYDPIHQAFHVGNIVLLVMPVCLAGIWLAEHRRDFAAGMVLAIATLLKPQLGIWILLYYAIQGRTRIIAGAFLPPIPFALAQLWYPVPLATILAGYRHNYQYWYGPGGPSGFTKGAVPFHVNNIQILLYQAWPNMRGVNLLAHGIFACALAIWMFALWRGKFRLPAPLAIAALLSLSFISLYHSVSDTSILVLALCWAIKPDNEREPSNRSSWNWSKRDWPQKLTCGVLLLMLLPGQSVLLRVAPHLSVAVTGAWWWRLLVARYFIWLLVALDGALLAGMLRVSRRRYRTESEIRHQDPGSRADVSLAS